MTNSADIVAGRCAVWGLPYTSACADVARTRLREVLGSLLPTARLDDCAVMVSELATNAFLHGLGGRTDRFAPDTARSELAVYRRGTENDAELVITVFDPSPDLDSIVESTANPLTELPEPPLRESPPDELLDKLLDELPDEPLPESPESGRCFQRRRWSGRRGLDTVRELSDGRYGFYRTTSRLGTWPVSGKAAWFAVPLSPGSPAARPPDTTYRPADAVHLLYTHLRTRGIENMIQSHLHDRSVLSLRHTTVWSDSVAYRWRTGDQTLRRPHADMTETVEQVVRVNEERR